MSAMFRDIPTLFIFFPSQSEFFAILHSFNLGCFVMVIGHIVVI
jgi:hypothetical protein